MRCSRRVVGRGVPAEPPPSRAHFSKRGFTLIEVMLVLVVIVIAVLVAVPSFTKSIGGARLRNSIRTISMANRYARSVAVLHQRQTALLYDMARHEIEVVSVGVKDQSAQAMFLEGRENRTGVESLDAEGGGEPGGGGSSGGGFSVQSELVRSLEAGVKIIEVDASEGGQELDGIYWLNFYPNGMCEKHVVYLRDENDRDARLEIDPMSGRAKVDLEK